MTSVSMTVATLGPTIDTYCWASLALVCLKLYAYNIINLESLVHKFVLQGSAAAPAMVSNKDTPYTSGHCPSNNLRFQRLAHVLLQQNKAGRGKLGA